METLLAGRILTPKRPIAAKYHWIGLDPRTLCDPFIVRVCAWRGVVMDEEIDIDGRSLSSLRVVDLKDELDKRKLSKSGTKKELLERLRSVSLGVD